MDWKSLNANVIAEFRENHGKIAQFGDLPVVILHTIGARTGNLLEVPLITIVEDDRMYLYGSNAGSKKHPVWIYNLRAHPSIKVEYGIGSFQATVKEFSTEDAARMVRVQAERTPQFADYVTKAAPRQITAFEICRDD
jgi:deazaflavin-dependent oxidoreductase (nitroreductase family)